MTKSENSQEAAQHIDQYLHVCVYEFIHWENDQKQIPTL